MDESNNASDDWLIDVSSADDWLLNSSPFGNSKEEKCFRITEATEDNKSQVAANSIEEMDSAPQPLEQSTDDWLLNSPFGSKKDEKSFQISEAIEDSKSQEAANSIEEMNSAPQPLEPSELDVSRKNKKYNLRKSLAWDSAFFTSDGFLDADEISNMIGNDEKSEKHPGSTGKSDKLMLPPIQEFVHRSTDSLSTLASETLTLESSECDLFEDVRASIKKSSKKAINIISSDVKVGAGTAEDRQTVRSSIKVGLATRNRLKPKVAPKKPGASIQVPGKVTKQVSQPVVKSGRLASAPLVSMQPKVMARVGPVSTISAKRTSLGANRVKIEKDSSNVTTGRVAMPKAPALGRIRNMVPRPAVRSKPSLNSSVSSKRELRTSCSSLESTNSASSSSAKQSPLNYLKKKNDVPMANTPSKSTTKTPLRMKSQPGRPQLSANLTSTKVSPSVSPASSISEWSVESSSSASTATLTYNSSRSSNLGKRFSVEGGNLQALDSEKYSTKQSSVGSHTRVPDESSKRASTGTGVLRPDSMKPTGLRMPSPKIGFFDGARSSGRTPNGGTQSHSGLTTGSPKVGSGSISPCGSLNKMKPVKPQQTTKPVTVIRGGKSVAQQTASGVKSKSPLPFKEPSNAATKISSTLRNVKGSSISPEVRTKESPKNVINDSAEKNFNPSDLKDMVLTESKEKAHLENQVGFSVEQVGVPDGKSSPAQEELAGNLLPVHLEQEQPSKILICSKNEELPSNKLAYVEVVANARIPFAAKDSFCNREGLLDVFTGETEKVPVREQIRRSNTIFGPNKLW